MSRSVISMKETCGLSERKDRTTLLHLGESDVIHVRIWLVSSALDSVEGRVWTAHTAIKSRGWSMTALLSVFVAYGHVAG